MRKDNTIFFLSGLGFGVLVGYFLFQSLVQAPAPMVASMAPSTERESVTATARIDPRELAALQRMAADNPEDPEVRLRIGTLYLESGQYERAVRWLREAVEKKGGDLHARNHLALALAGMGRIDEAISEYEAALALDPSHPQSMLGLGRLLLYGKKDVQRGIEVWERLVAVAPGSPEAQSVREGLEALKSAHSGS